MLIRGIWPPSVPMITPPCLLYSIENTIQKSTQGHLFDGGWLKADRLAQWPKLGTSVSQNIFLKKPPNAATLEGQLDKNPDSWAQDRPRAIWGFKRDVLTWEHQLDSSLL